MVWFAKDEIEAGRKQREDGGNEKEARALTCFICEEVHGPLEECSIFGLAYDQIRQLDLLGEEDV